MALTEFADEQRVTVGRRMRRHLGADVVAAARPVLDEERLAELRRPRYCATSRPMMSVEPPADVATRTRTGRDG